MHTLRIGKIYIQTELGVDTDIGQVYTELEAKQLIIVVKLVYNIN